jgi:hypothetical protein
LDEFILCNPKTLSWWNFRQELIWTLEVDDLFKANAHHIKKLYQSFHTMARKTFSIEEAIAWIPNYPGLRLSDKETALAFAYSKFPVIDEMTDIM